MILLWWAFFPNGKHVAEIWLVWSRLYDEVNMYSFWAMNSLIELYNHILLIVFQSNTYVFLLISVHALRRGLIRYLVSLDWWSSSFFIYGPYDRQTRSYFWILDEVQYLNLKSVTSLFRPVLLVLVEVASWAKLVIFYRLGNNEKCRVRCTKICSGSFYCS